MNGVDVIAVMDADVEFLFSIRADHDANNKTEDARAAVVGLIFAMETILDGLVDSRDDIQVDDWIDIAGQALARCTGAAP